MSSRSSEPGEPQAPDGRSGLPGLPGSPRSPRSSEPAGAASQASASAPQASAGQAGAPNAPGDHELLRRIQAGDQGAFAVLVERYQQRAFRVARNMLPSREDAEDLAQEAFLRVYRSVERFDFKHEFTTWLYRIVTNLCIDHLRKRRPAVSTSAGEDQGEALQLPDESAPRPSAGLEQDETQVRVRAVIDSLAPHFQSVLTLRELEGLSCIAIAEIVEATHVTVRWRLHRGRKLFQDEWERRERLAAAGLDPEGKFFTGAEHGSDGGSGGGSPKDLADDSNGPRSRP